MLEFKLPSLGADMDQGKLLEWKIQPGDEVKKGQVVAVVDTSKAAIDVEIWFDGKVHELLVDAGETVPVGTVLASLLAPGETAPAAGEARAAGPAAERRRISPAARKHARELGLDVEKILGTGPGGAVTLADVDKSAAATPAQAAAAAAPADRPAEMRQAIAAAMSRSKREIPHYYLSETVPMQRSLDWLSAANASRPITERLLMAVLQLKAVALALKRFPEMNGHFRDGAFQPAAAAHIGVAISLRQGGLIAPAIHDVAGKSLNELMHELADLVTRTRAGSLKSSEMTDATITVTNIGEQGVDAVFGIIYPPQVALVGFGRIAPRPWVEDGRLVVAPTVTASLAADHRVSDGHRGALFLAELRDRLQEPEQL